MPRMRMVKPEFWTDSKVVRVSRDARLFFIGLWNFADCDAGHVEADPFALKMKIFPADDVKVSVLIDELQQIGLIDVQQSSVGEFILIPGLRSHQKTDSRWTPRCRVCKAEKEGSLKLTETHVSSGEFTETHPNSSNLTPVGEGRGGVGKGEVGRGEVLVQQTFAEEEPEEPSPKKRKRRQYPDDFNQFWSAYPKNADKPVAFKAWEKAIHRADAEEIIEGAERYRDDPNRSDAYTKNAATWLNADAWENGPLPERSGSLTFDQQRVRNNNQLFQDINNQIGGDMWTQDSSPKQIGQ